MTAPSGAGKTTIVRHLLKKIENLSFSVSATTRPPREGEVDGKDYYFLSEKQFRKKIKKEAFAEWEEVYPGKFYGTLKKEIKRIWKEGKHIVFDIEVKGATNIKKIYGDQALAIFIKPPSIEELLNRLKKRDTESDNNIQLRIARAKEEMTYQNKFDRVLVNDVLAIALIEAEEMVQHFIQQATDTTRGKLEAKKEKEITADKVVTEEKVTKKKKAKEKEQKEKKVSKKTKSKKKSKKKKKKKDSCDIEW